VRIAVPLRDFGGRTVFHCHIAEHEDLGMMGVLAV
jgi:FtsP/CotA-like multicopper oxidase with cupredoxin domain